MKDYYKIPFKKIIKIPNPTVDLPIQKDKEAWTFGDKVVLFVGRLEPQILTITFSLPFDNIFK